MDMNTVQSAPAPSAAVMGLDTLGRNVPARVVDLRAGHGEEEQEDFVENHYTLKLINKSQETRRFRISLEQEGSGLRLAGNELVEAGPEQVLPVTLSVIASDGIGGRREVSFVVESEDGRERRVIKSSFFGPRQ